jgi:hypothetical protein
MVNELFIGQIYTSSPPQYDEKSHKKSVMEITLEN